MRATSLHRAAQALIAAALMLSGGLLHSADTEPPIDVQRGRALMEKSKRGETLTAEEHAYFDRVKKAIRTRARELAATGQKPLDALHLACAEAAGADCFLTCDDRLIRRYVGPLTVQTPPNFISNQPQP